MKVLLKTLLVLVLAGLVLSFGLAVALVYSPGLQKALLLAAAPQRPGVTVALDRVHLRPGRAELRGLELRAGAESLRLDALELRFSSAELLRRRLRVDAFVVNGLVLDIAATGGKELGAALGADAAGERGKPAPPAPAAPPRDPLAQARELRGRASIDGVALEAAVLLPEGVRLDMVLKGGGIRAGESGELRAELAAARAAAPLAAGSFLVRVDATDREWMLHYTATGSADLRAISQLAVPGQGQPLSTGRLRWEAAGKMAERHRIEAEIALDELVAAEWEALLGLLPEEEAPAAKDTRPDAAPPWAGLEGRILARIDRLQVGAETIADARAELRIEDGRRVRATLGAVGGGAPLRADAVLDFDDSRPDLPYALAGSLDVRGLDVTPFLRPPDPRKPGILEGAFNVRGQFQARAPNLALLGERAAGEFVLESSRGGVFRPLGERTAAAQGISGLIGGLAGGVRQLRWIQEVVDQVQEIPYTRVSFRMGREPSLDWFLRDLDLVSREVRIRGGGRLQHVAGATLADLAALPVDFQFQLHAKGRLAESLRAGNQLRAETPDELGFLPGPPLPIRGSLAQPESLFVNLLMESAQGLLPGLLRGR